MRSNILGCLLLFSLLLLPLLQETAQLKQRRPLSTPSTRTRFGGRLGAICPLHWCDQRLNFMMYIFNRASSGCMFWSSPVSMFLSPPALSFFFVLFISFVDFSFFPSISIFLSPGLSPPVPKHLLLLSKCPQIQLCKFLCRIGFSWPVVSETDHEILSICCLPQTPVLSQRRLSAHARRLAASTESVKARRSPGEQLVFIIWQSVTAPQLVWPKSWGSKHVLLASSDLKMFIPSCYPLLPTSLSLCSVNFVYGVSKSQVCCASGVVFYCLVRCGTALNFLATDHWPTGVGDFVLVKHNPRVSWRVLAVMVNVFLSLFVTFGATMLKLCLLLLCGIFSTTNYC